MNSIDRLVAERVMEWTEYQVGSGRITSLGGRYWYPPGITPRIPPFQAGAVPVELFKPASDMTTALQIAEHMRSKLWNVTIYLQSSSGCTMHRYHESYYSEAETVPLAICISALKACGVAILAQVEDQMGSECSSK